MDQTKDSSAVSQVVIGSLVAVLLGAAIVAIFCFAPTEQTMGHSQRIVYVHVPMAWLGLLGFMFMAASGVGYLVRRNLAWDHWGQTCGELGWLCSSLTLATGSLWAHEAWGTWWEWDPRLTTSLILWCIYSAILMTRASIEDPHQRARIGAVLAVLGTLDIPLVVMATRWFRGMHPVSPEMDPSMRITLLVSLVAFTALFAWLATCRRVQVGTEHLATQLGRRIEQQANPA